MPSDAELYQRLEASHGFSIPREYREMRAKGRLTFDPAGRALPQPYLWLSDMEWIPLERIPDFEFPSYCKSGFVPFAFTCGGDHWCWYPEHSVEGVAPVVLCPRDSCVGQFYARDFSSALYRHILEYAASYMRPDEEIEARGHIKRWLDDLGPFFPNAWRKTVEALQDTPVRSWRFGRSVSHSLLLPEEYQSIVERDLAFAKLDGAFKWMDD